MDPDFFLKIFRPEISLVPKKIWNKKNFGPKIFSDLTFFFNHIFFSGTKFFSSNFFSAPILFLDLTFFLFPNFFFDIFFRAKSFLNQIFLDSKFVWTQKFLDPIFVMEPNFLWTHNFFRTKIVFGPNICLGLRDFHWRRGMKPFQAEHFRLSLVLIYDQPCFMVWYSKMQRKKKTIYFLHIFLVFPNWSCDIFGNTFNKEEPP